MLEFFIFLTGDTCRTHQLVREAADLSNWLKRMENHADMGDISDDMDPESLNHFRHKMNEFKADLMANEARLQELNEIVMTLNTINETDVRLKLEGEMIKLNEKWREVQLRSTKNADKFERATEVQTFHRDVDDIKDWINEKQDALNSEEMGKDLRQVQQLMRKHEGLERDLAALQDKINEIDSKA